MFAAAAGGGEAGMAIDRTRQGLSLSIQLQIEMKKPEHSALRIDAVRNERIVTLKRDAQHPDTPWQKPVVNTQSKI